MQTALLTYCVEQQTVLTQPRSKTDIARLVRTCDFLPMHPIPAASELQSLIGRELGQIALDPYSVQFRWDEGGFIRSEFDVEHVDEDGNSWRYDCVAHSGPPLKLHRLLQKKVESLEVEELCLTLLFEGGAKLRLFTEIGLYECGLIQFTEDASDYVVY